MGSVKLSFSGRECFFPISSSIKSLELTSFLLALPSEPLQTGTRMFWKGCDLQLLPFGHFKKQFKNKWIFKTCSFQLQLCNIFFLSIFSSSCCFALWQQKCMLCIITFWCWGVKISLSSVRAVSETLFTGLVRRNCWTVWICNDAAS